MTQADAIQMLDQLDAKQRGFRALSDDVHEEADRILLDFLRANFAGKVADAYEAARDRVGFWYA